MADGFRDFEELIVEAERELALRVLGNGDADLFVWLKQNLETMASKKLRVPVSLMPDWYRQMWPDATQIDGLAILKEVSVVTVTVLGRTPWEPGLEYTTQYTIDFREFARALFARQIGSAS